MIEEDDYDPLAEAEAAIKAAQQREQQQYQLETKEDALLGLQKQLSVQQTLVKDLSAQLEAIRSEAALSQEQANRNLRDLSVKQDQIDSLKSHLTTSAQSFQEQLAAMRESLESANSQLDSHLIELKTLRLLRDQLRLDNESLRKDQQQLKDQVTRAEGSLSGALARCEEARLLQNQQEDVLEKKNETLLMAESTVVQRERDLCLLRDQLKESEGKLLQVQRDSSLRLTAASEKLRELHLQLNGADVPLPDLAPFAPVDLGWDQVEVLLGEKQALLLSLSHEKDSLQARDIALAASSLAANRLRAQLEEERSANQQQLIALQSERGALSLALEEAENATQMARTWEGQCKDQQLRVSQLESLLEKQRALLEAERKERDTAIADMSVMNEVVEQRSVISALRSDLEHASAQSQDLRVHLERAEQEKKALSAQLERVQRSLDDSLTRRSRVFRPITAGAQGQVRGVG